MEHPVAAYLAELYQVSGVGVPETSGYPALSKLLNAVGDSLKPKICAIIHPSNAGAGIPDGVVFSVKHLEKHGVDSPSLLKLKPERGVIEVKPLDKELAFFEHSEQVIGYLKHYGQILLTNHRSFSTKPSNSPTTSAASPPCWRWTRTPVRMFNLFSRDPILRL